MNHKLKELHSIEMGIHEVYNHCFRNCAIVDGFEFHEKESWTLMKCRFDVPFMNGIINFNYDAENIKTVVNNLVRELKDHGRSFQWRFGPNTSKVAIIEEVLLENGLTKSAPHQTVFSSISHDLLSKYDFKDELTFEDVNMENFDEWFEIFCGAFQIAGEFADFFKEFEKLSQERNLGYKSYLGRNNHGRAVAEVSTLVTAHPLAGLFNIGVPNEERGKSYGMQATLFGVKKMLEEGKQMIGQYGSPDGVKSYARLGAKLGNLYSTYQWTAHPK